MHIDDNVNENDFSHGEVKSIKSAKYSSSVEPKSSKIDYSDYDITIKNEDVDADDRHDDEEEEFKNYSEKDFNDEMEKCMKRYQRLAKAKKKKFIGRKTDNDSE